MNISYKKSLWVVCLLAVLLTVPFLGLTDFYSKGEPREAVVAYTMLEHGNWILPVNNGGDIPYKPPFFHWCIALCSLLQGHVDEYTSRLPSALALIGMAVGTFMFYARRKGNAVALLGTALLLTCFEVHRAGTNCRVDMMNTAFMVTALLFMYRWWQRGMRQLPWWAILCMSGAALTKGPVGILLPCLVMGVFLLTQRTGLWAALWRMALTAVCAALLPLLWYYAAWQQGGDEFLRLVKEENIDRLTGKMSYESHVNPFWYNFVTLVSGWLPHTLLMLFSLFVLPWRRFTRSRFVQNVRKADSLQWFTWLAFGIILFFYCIPKSKRSVYLLPCYPFMAILMAQYVIWMAREKAGALKVYAGVLAALVLALNVAFFAVRMGWIPDSLFHGKHAAENIAMLHALEQYPLHGWRAGILLLTLAGGWMTVRYLRRGQTGRMAAASVCTVAALFLALDSTLQPPVLNTKADKPQAARIAQRFDMNRLYSYMSVDMLHFFSLNFYLGDRIQQFGKARPREGVLMIPEEDFPGFKATLGRGYRMWRVWQIPRAVEWKHEVGFYRFVEETAHPAAIHPGTGLSSQTQNPLPRHRTLRLEQ